MQVLYTAVASVTGGRNGRATSSNGVLDVEVRSPKALGGANDDYTNPEQLFAAGYSACFDSALSLVARTAKIRTGTTKVTSHVSLGKNEEGHFGLAITMEVNVPGVEQSIAEDLVNKAHQVCPYSRSIKGNVDVIFKVTTND